MPAIENLFIAEAVKLSVDATLSVIGLGLRGVAYPPDASEITVSAGVTLARELGEGEATLSLTVEAPDAAYSVSQTITMDPVESGSDFALTVVAVRIPIPIAGPGRYVIRGSVDESASAETYLWLQPAQGSSTAGSTEE